MFPRDRERLDRIEELKSKLFNKNYQTKIEYRDNFPHSKKIEVMDSWGKKELPEESLESRNEIIMKTSIFKKFFVFSLVFFLIALGYAGYMFLIRGNTVSNNNIDISVLSNAYTAGGEEYPLLLEIINKNNSPLLLVDLVVEYPKNSVSSSTKDNDFLRMSLGTIPAGGIKNENIKITLFGEQGSTQDINISLEYRVEGSNAIFVKEKKFEISINSTPINLSVDAPTEISSNQDMTLDIKSTLNATKAVSNMLIKVDYPIGFQFDKATPEPSFGNNVWEMGDFAPGSEHSIMVFGKMIDVSDGEEKVFRVWSGSQSTADKASIETIFNTIEHFVLIQKSSIEANLLINGISSVDYAVDTKTPVQGQIRWKNNLETKITDLVITAKITGNAVNRKTISSNQGFYNSSSDTIVWDKNSQSKFAEIDPGDGGEVSFSFSPLSLYSAGGGMISSPYIDVEISVKGEQADNNGVVADLTNKQIKNIKVISDLGLTNKALYYSGAYTNTGPMPPKVEQKTTYTIVWSLSNTSNNISEAKVISTLPSWMRFVGIFTPTAEDLTYNSSTKEITWNVGRVQKGAGITDAKKEVSFQVELTPSLSQVGTNPIILNNTTLTGHDDFANVDIKVNKTALDNKLLSDTTLPPNGGKVVN